MKIKLTSNNPLTQLVHSNGIVFWEDLLIYTQEIPYGRNANREDFSLILKENKGTCSSKHAFLKEIANQNDIINVKLIIGIYKMNETNTNIGSILTEHNMEYIPEAHCYLKVNGMTVDVTSREADFEKIKTDLLEEIEIEPYQVGEFKINYHKKFITNWIQKTNQDKKFDEIWTIREKCIQKLAEK